MTIVSYEVTRARPSRVDWPQSKNIFESKFILIRGFSLLLARILRLKDTPATGLLRVAGDTHYGYSLCLSKRASTKIRRAARGTQDKVPSLPRFQSWVPQPAAQPQPSGVLTDTQAVRLLGSYHPSQRNLLAASPTPSPDDRPCPNCHQLVPGLCRICPSCNTYLGNTG